MTEAEGAAFDAPSVAAGPVRFSVKLVAGVVLGGVGVVALLLLHGGLLSLACGVVAVVLGHLGLRDIRASGERSRGLGVVALTTGYLCVAVAVVEVLAVLVISQGSQVTTVPDACTSKTGNFTQRQLQQCFDQTNP